MKVVVIVPFYNQFPYLKLTIESLERTYSDYTLVGVNNLSTDPSTEYMKEKADVVVDVPDRNISTIWNKGVEVVEGDVYMFANSDIFFYPNTIERVIRGLEKTGIAQPLRIEGTAPHQVRVEGILGRAFTTTNGGICGPCFVMTKKLIDELIEKDGFLFDEQFKLWYGDSDLLWRLSGMERIPQDVQNALIFHHLSKTLQTIPGWTNLIEEDAERFNKKYKRG